MPHKWRAESRGEGQLLPDAAPLVIGLQQCQAAFIAREQNPNEAHRALELSESTTPDALAAPETTNYQTQGFSL